MEKKFSLILDDEFILFCKINNIVDVEKMAKEVFQKGFTLVKYGDEPKGFLKSREKWKEETDKKYEQPSIVEGKEKSNVKVVTSPRPEVMPAPQPVIKKENNLYDE